MKSLVFIGMFIVAMSFVSCGNSTTTANENDTTIVDTVAIDTTNTDSAGV